MPPPTLQTRTRLSEVRYEIRGELARRARELEAQGRTLIKLNIGNPGAFGFRAPEHLQRARRSPPSIASAAPRTPRPSACSSATASAS